MACLALLAGGGAERAGGLVRDRLRKSKADAGGRGSSRPDFRVPRAHTALFRVGVVSGRRVSRSRSGNPKELQGIGNGAVGTERRVLWVAGCQDTRLSPVRSVGTSALSAQEDVELPRLCRAYPLNAKGNLGGRRGRRLARWVRNPLAAVPRKREYSGESRACRR